MPTIAEQIYQAIVEDIAAGRMAPGQRIEEQAIADRFGVSRTPVRDALRRLAGSGFVEFTPNRGVSIKQPDLQELGDILEALEEVEALCARFASQRMTAVERRRLMKLVTQQEEAIEGGNVEGYREYNGQFHETIYRGARNGEILMIAEMLRTKLKPFTNFIFALNPDFGISMNEHRKIVSAIMAGDGDGAAAAARDHAANANLRLIDLQRDAALPITPERRLSLSL